MWLLLHIIIFISIQFNLLTKILTFGVDFNLLQVNNYIKHALNILTHIHVRCEVLPLEYARIHKYLHYITPQLYTWLVERISYSRIHKSNMFDKDFYMHVVIFFLWDLKTCEVQLREQVYLSMTTNIYYINDHYANNTPIQNDIKCWIIVQTCMSMWIICIIFEHHIYGHILWWLDCSVFV